MAPWGRGGSRAARACLPESSARPAAATPGGPAREARLGSGSNGSHESGGRRLVSVVFSAAQDVVYVALGVLLAVTAAIMLVRGGVELVHLARGEVDVRGIVAVLDRILLALMVVELLYTVQVSFRERALVPQPFLLVALIAAVRRILVITAEFSAQAGIDERLFRHVMWELALLTVLVLVLVGSLLLLQRAPPERSARSHHD